MAAAKVDELISSHLDEKIGEFDNETFLFLRSSRKFSNIQI